MYLVCANKLSGGGGELAASNMGKILSKHETTYFLCYLELRLYKICGDNFNLIPLYKFISVFRNSKCIYSHLYISNILTLLLSTFLNKNIVIFNQGSPRNISFFPRLQISLIRLLYPLAKKIYCVSSEVLQDLTNLGLKGSEIRQINNPILLDNQPNVMRSTDTYIYVGRIEKIKNVDKIIRATEKTKSKIKIFGNGSLIQQLERSFPEAWRLAYRGRTNNAVTEIARSKALLLMSEREGIPMVALEAIYTSTPIIVPKNLTALHFLLGSIKTTHETFDVHANGIMLHDNDCSNLAEALKFIKNGTLTVSEKNVLNDFSIELFEKALLLN